MATFVWSKNTVRESLHISIFCGRDPFCEVVRRAGEHTWESRQVCLSDQQTSPFAWVASGSLFSVQNYWPCIVFSSLMRKYEPASSPTYFLFMAGYQNLLTWFFFFFFLLVICWSYQQTEISVILSTGNKLQSRHPPSFFSFLWNHFVDVILRPHWIC